MDTIVLPKPAYNVLRRLTGESRPDIALSLALEDLVNLRLEAAQRTISAFETKYQVSFVAFEERWQRGEIQGKHAFQTEQDLLNWEAATTDLKALQELSEWPA